MRKMQGRGDYKAVQAQAADVIKRALKSAVSKGLRSGGAALGGMAGAKFGAPARGSAIGRGLGAKLSKLLGSGDYETNTDQVATNSLFRAGPKSASFETTATGIRLQHREYIQDIFAQQERGLKFSNNQFPVNPGLSSVFPYLAQIASNFEQYRFHGLVFEFVSSTSQYGATSLGTNIAAMQYNSGAPAFQTKQTMENSDYAVSARIDRNVMYGVECAPGSQALNYLLVRSPGVQPTALITSTAAASAVQFYDLGLFNFATNTTTVSEPPGLITGSPMGELWVTYDVELIRPRISPARYGYLHLSASTPTPASPLGTISRTTINYGTLGVAAYQIQPTYLQLPNTTIGDTFMMTIVFSGTIAAAVILPVITLVGASFTNIFNGNTQSIAQDLPLPAAATGMSATYCFTITAESPVIAQVNFGTGGVYPTGAGGAAKVDVIIVSVANGLSPDTGTI